MPGVSNRWVLQQECVYNSVKAPVGEGSHKLVGKVV